jgi:hypothetical protein
LRLSADLREPAQAVFACGLRIEQHRAVALAGEGCGRIAALARVPFVGLRLGPARAQHARERKAGLARLVDDEKAHGEAGQDSAYSAGVGRIDKAWRT